MKKGITILIAVACVLNCSGKYKAAENVAKLTISFVDQEWDHQKVPKSGQCRNCGGEGLSPALLVKNIPKQTDALIVEFNDKSMPNLSNNGGHGAIRLQISGKEEFVIPSVQEQTYDLPQGIEIESEHRAPVGKPGAYMAPCGCGNENKYEATVMAIKNEQSGKKMIVGKGTISIGRF